MRPFGKNVLVPFLSALLAGPSLTVGAEPQAAAPLAALPAPASSTPVSPPLTQAWTTTTLISANDDWSGVSGIVGYLGDYDPSASPTDVNPQTVVVPMTTVDVIANQAAPNSLTSGGVAEFDGIADPTIALQGSGTADAPNVVFFLNTTGFVGIKVAYNVRDVDGSGDNAVQQVALQYRVGNSGNFTNIAAGYIADATEGGTATKVTAVDVTLPPACDNQAEVQVRVLTTNATGSDEWVGIDDVNITGTAAGNILTIGDVTVTEGSSGTVTASFTVALTQPAGVGGVTFDIATADGTGASGAVAPTDYVAQSISPATIPATQQSFQLDVTVNGDTTPEATETFTVTVTNVNGATISDGQAVGRIVSDDPMPIGQVQGTAVESPYAGAEVLVSGVVTGVRADAFFLQDSGDANAATSDGVLVYTSSIPTVSVGNAVLVKGNVVEYRPSQDPTSPPFTQITSPTVTPQGTGALPAPVVVTTAETDPAGGLSQLEKYEGMRVSVPTLTVIAPTRATLSETNGGATSQGLFYGVLPGVARPFREAGVQAPDAAPVVNAPVFDNNPERIRVASLALLGAAAIDVATGQTVTGLVGPLDYAFRCYTVDVDPAAVSPAPVVSGPAAAQPVPDATADEFTVATLNVQRFFDAVNDPPTSDFEPVLTPTWYANRVAKASLLIRTVLRNPDVIGLQEIEKKQVLLDVAANIATNGGPSYLAEWIAGNDPTGANVGYLYKASPRLTGVTIAQIPGSLAEPMPGSSSKLFDHPPLALRAAVNHPTNGQSYPITVIDNHAKSIGGVTNEAFTQTKRQKQAEFLATYLDSIQDSENLIVIGDMNAYEFNDAFVDVMGTILGNPTPPDEVLVSSPDLVDPNLVLLTTSARPGRYSYNFDGNAHYFDHVAVDEGVATIVTRVANAHAGSDFPPAGISPSGVYGDPTRPERLTDHDPVVAYFLPSTFGPWTVPTTGFYSVAPCRLLDTRDPDGPLGGPVLSANQTRTFKAAESCGVPLGAKAVAVNVTVTQPGADGYLTLFPEGRPQPLASTINFRSGQTRANNAEVSLGLNGTFSIFGGLGTGGVHVIVDVVGYFD